jgi:hypothetical protein
VDGVQDIAVSSDLLLETVHRFGAPGHEIANTLPRSHHALDPVRGLSAVNDGALAKRLKHLGRLLLEQRLFAAIFADEPDALQEALTENLSS